MTRERQLAHNKSGIRAGAVLGAGLQGSGGQESEAGIRRWLEETSHTRHLFDMSRRAPLSRAELQAPTLSRGKTRFRRPSDPIPILPSDRRPLFSIEQRVQSLGVFRTTSKSSRDWASCDCATSTINFRRPATLGVVYSVPLLSAKHFAEGTRTSIVLTVTPHIATSDISLESIALFAPSSDPNVMPSSSLCEPTKSEPLQQPSSSFLQLTALEEQRRGLYFSVSVGLPVPSKA